MGGGTSDASLPLKFALIELEKISRHIWKALKKSWGVLYILIMSKNAIYMAKNAVKNQTFFLSGKLIISLIRNVRLPFSNADSEAGM